MALALVIPYNHVHEHHIIASVHPLSQATCLYLLLQCFTGEHLSLGVELALGQDVCQAGHTIHIQLVLGVAGRQARIGVMQPCCQQEPCGCSHRNKRQDSARCIAHERPMRPGTHASHYLHASELVHKVLQDSLSIRQAALITKDACQLV